MTVPIRILDTPPAPGRWNVAMTAALVQRHSDGLAPDTVRFHRYSTCVLIGSSQRLASAADVDYCRRHGIDIARRITGGGAVFMSPRMLAFDVVLERRSQAGGLDGITRRVCEAIADGLAKLGAPVRFDPPNAIGIAGTKISGTSGYVEGPSAVLQGTVLIEDDLAEMACALAIPEATLRARVSCLAGALGAVPPLAKVRAAMLAGLTEGLDRWPLAAAPEPEELARAEQLMREAANHLHGCDIEPAAEIVQ